MGKQVIHVVVNITMTEAKFKLRKSEPKFA